MNEKKVWFKMDNMLKTMAKKVNQILSKNYKNKGFVIIIYDMGPPGDSFIIATEEESRTNCVMQAASRKLTLNGHLSCRDKEKGLEGYSSCSGHERIIH